MIYISEISNKPLERGNNNNQDQTFDLLEKLNIDFSCVSNDVVETMEECEELDKVLEVEIRKSLLVRNQKKTRYYLVVMPASKRCDMKELALLLDENKLSFASSSDMLSLLNSIPGSLSIMGLINDKDNSVQLVFDKSILDSEYFGCNTGTNKSHLKLKTSDVIDKILPYINHNPIIIDIE